MSCKCNISDIDWNNLKDSIPESIKTCICEGNKNKLTAGSYYMRMKKKKPLDIIKRTAGLGIYTHNAHKSITMT